MSVSDAEIPEPHALPPGAEPCPAPLNWSEVLATVATETQTLVLPCPGQGADSQMTARVYGNGPPLYFLGGASGSGTLFDLTAYLLRDQFTTVRLNHPTNPIHPRTLLAVTATMIRELAEGLGHLQPAIYAAGVGCDVVLELVRQSPGKLQRVLLQGPSVQQVISWRERFLRGVGRYFARPIATLPGWKAVQTENHQRYFPPFDHSRFQFLLDDLGATPIRDVACRHVASAAADWSELLPTLNLPVMVIRTEGEGRQLTSEAERFSRFTPGAVTEWLHSAGHFPHLTHPHRLVKVLKQFLLPE